LGFGGNQQKEWNLGETWKETETSKVMKEKVNRSKKDNRILVHKHNIKK